MKESTNSPNVHVSPDTVALGQCNDYTISGTECRRYSIDGIPEPNRSHPLDLVRRLHKLSVF